MPERIEAVLFDCDGVLVDSEILAAEVEMEALAAAGLSFETREYQSRFMGMSNSDLFAALDAEAAARLGKPLGPAFFKAMKERYRVELRKRLQPVAGARQAVESTALPKAVASSSDPDHLALKLDITGLADHFGPHIYPSALVARGKPAPDLFLYTANKLGVAAEACLVLEDSANGIKAAKAAGMFAVGVLAGRHCGPDHGSRLSEAGADDIFQDFAPLKALILRQSTS